MASELYKIRALVESEIPVQEGEELEDFKMLLSEGDLDRVADEAAEYDTALNVNLTDPQVKGWEIVDADGKVVARSGGEVPHLIAT